MKTVGATFKHQSKDVKLCTYNNSVSFKSLEQGAPRNKELYLGRLCSLLFVFKNKRK